MAEGEEKPDYATLYETLLADNKKMREEFNTQRAKLKELFLQKEADLRRLTESNEQLQDQVAVLHLEKERELEEVASLKAFVQETINEARDEDDVKRLFQEIERLRSENSRLHGQLLKQEAQSSPGHSLAPVLNQVKKFALKIGNERESPETAEESRRAAGSNPHAKYAQEDAEVLRSLVEPLEEEIKALKEKLRSTDEDLQRFVVASPAHTPVQPQCARCMEAEVEASLKTARVETLERQLAGLNEDLEQERKLRAELEREWQENQEAHNVALTQLSGQLQRSEEQLGRLTEHFQGVREELQGELGRLVEERQRTHRHLEQIQRENALLAGIYMKNADELEAQEISLPNSVPELQEMLLQARHNIIEARVGWESERLKGVSLAEELDALRTQFGQTLADAQEQSRRLQANVAEYAKLRQQAEKLQQQLQVARESNERLDADFRREMGELREQNIQLLTARDQQGRLHEELRNKVLTLQQSLESGEAVQQDFVRLSQSLQMQLEKIRVQDAQVRWQDDEDVDTCANCSAQFTVTRRKQHCRHCGSIYCERCLTKSVPSGPRKRPAKVCDVCHTLLNSHTAPFFSSAAPQSPV